MEQARFFELKPANYHLNSADYEDFDIIDVDTHEQLDQVCAKMYSGVFDPVSGATGFLHSDKYEGYCQLYYTYRKKDDDGIITIEFTPAYTKDGDFIFIKSDTECSFCAVGAKFDYDRETYKTIERSYITFFLKWFIV